MAMMDNVEFLINHIRNSFVTSDDTSMSEWVITECRIQDDNEIKQDGTQRSSRGNLGSRSDSNSDCQSDTDIRGSMDIHPDMDFGAHRRRSNTAQRLERLKKEKRNQVKLKTVQWREMSDTYRQDERGHLFEKKQLVASNPAAPADAPQLVASHPVSSVDASHFVTSHPVSSVDASHFVTSHPVSSVDASNFVDSNPVSSVDAPDHLPLDDDQHTPLDDLQAPHNQGDNLPSQHLQVSGADEHKPRVASALTQQLQDFEVHGSNPFFKYAKFDGRTAGGLATRKLDIFLAFALPEQRAYPMNIIVMANAKAQEVIGLVLWQYMQEGRKPDLETVAGHIDPNDLVHKFSLHMAEDDGEIDTDFPSIVPTDPVSKYGFTKFALVANAPVQPKAVVVTINVPNRGFNKFQVESMSLTMKELMEKIIKKRKIKLRPGLNYTLEKASKSEAGKPVDLDASLGSMNCLEFYLIRENSSRGAESNGEEDQKTTDILMSHNYKSFKVSMVHKLRANTEVQLGISGDKIEIDPVSMKGTARIFRQKPVTYDADNIAACDITETRNNGRAVFKMTYLTGHDYKHHYFEADQNVASEIVAKVNNILELKFSPVRKEFIFSQEKKALQRKDSLKRDSLRPGY